MNLHGLGGPGESDPLIFELTPVQVFSSGEASDLNGLSGLDPAAQRSVVVPV